MRYESCVTSLSWIPSEAVTGATRTAFDSGFTHYDDPPPAELGDIEELRAGDRFRFANVLRAWIEVDDSGRITGGGYDGSGIMGATTLRLGGLSHTFQAVPLPDLQRTPEQGEGWMRFVQTTGGRTAIPAPRPVRRRPFVQWQAPLVWTTLSLTLHADGRAEYSVTGASRFPRHWIYDADGRLAHKSGLTDYANWTRVSDRFRFANVLRAWIEVDDSGRIMGGGYDGSGIMGATTLRLGGLSHTFQAVALPDMQRTPEQGEGWMRFVQTTGGRTAIPAPRPVRRRPFVQWQAPLVWTTLSLTLHADGRAEYSVTGASRFPRHWIYDADGRLAHKSGLTDYANWTRVSFGRHTPWGDEDSPALVTAVETALEQALSVQLMHGAAKPRITQLQAGDELVRQGDFGQDIYLVLDGVIRVERDGARLAEYGPGAMLGERAVLEGGTRTSTLVAVTRCRVASVPAVQLDLSDLAELSTGHRREEGVRG